MRRVAWCLALCLALPTAGASGWIEVRDHAVRAEVRRLVDLGHLQLPGVTWPMPVSLLGEAMARAVSDGRAEPGTFERLRQGLAERAGVSTFAAAADAPTLREPGAAWRDESELGVRWDTNGADPVSSGSADARWSAAAAVSVSRSDSGEQLVRFDGSHLTARWGNWQLGASVQDRYWGPGNDGSLILSDNARPMPALVVERATAAPFETRWLSWIGPWRASLFAARMEGERRDVDHPLFLGARVTAAPRPWLEVGLSRTAQVCGRGRPCNLRTLRDLLLGNDNLGIDATSGTEPGNQMAGIDLRVRSPWVAAPVAVYAQVIGEDESSYFPVKNLALYGVETWRSVGTAGNLRAFVEYADTSCSYDRPQPRFNCAYTQGVFNVDGYRYRGRAIGHTSDADSQTWSVGLALTEGDADQWELRLRDARINRGGAIDPNHSISSTPADHQSLQVGWRGRRGPHRVDATLGYERLAPIGAAAESGLTAALRWEWRVP